METGLKNDSPPDLSDEAGTVSAEVPVNEKALLRKLDLRLLPAVGILYLLSFLDRSNGITWFTQMDDPELMYRDQLVTLASKG